MKTQTNQSSGKPQQGSQARLNDGCAFGGGPGRNYKTVKASALALLGVVSLIGFATGCASMQGGAYTAGPPDNGSFKYNSEFDYRVPGTMDRF